MIRIMLRRDTANPLSMNRKFLDREAVSKGVRWRSGRLLKPIWSAIGPGVRLPIRPFASGSFARAPVMADGRDRPSVMKRFATVGHAVGKFRDAISLRRSITLCMAIASGWSEASPSGAIIDSQSVKTTGGGELKGRKRHALVDPTGAASCSRRIRIQDRDGGLIDREGLCRQRLRRREGQPVEKPRSGRLQPRRSNQPQPDWQRTSRPPSPGPRLPLRRDPSCSSSADWPEP